MQFLADESCDFAVVRALRLAHHDVIAIAELDEGAEDEDVLRMAVRQGKIVVTEDRDFGRLVFATAAKSVGVLYLRFPARARGSMPAAVLDVVHRYSDRLPGAFVTLQPGRVRFRRQPT